MSETEIKDDLSALAWVQGELRRSLETANKALRRYLRESEAASVSDVDAVDPAVLRGARAQLHQGVGALELVGMPAEARVLRAAESALQRLMARPAMIDAAAVGTIEQVSFALLDYLGRRLAGKAVSPLLLFPPYRAALQLAGADRIHPADLWPIDWQWQALPPDALATPRSANEDARTAMETLVLTLIRQGDEAGASAALAQMSDLCAELGAGARQTSIGDPHSATFWQLAAAVFEAQAQGLLQPDAYAKRIASRLMAQLRMRVKGPYEISDRLAQDLLFFCCRARAPADTRAAPRLALVRAAWQLDAQPLPDYEKARLGRFDPALLALARRRVAAARDTWSAVAGAEMHRLPGMTEQFALVGDSLQRLFPSGETLAQALQTAVGQTAAGGAAPPPALAMEVATAILYLDASLEDGELDHPDLAQRVQALARRIDDVRIGAEPQPLDSWMEDLYRRVSDRQTMGSVVQELRASLSEIEKQIDQYFRDPTQRQVLVPVPNQLSAMRGVLSVLGMDQASAAALHMRDDVDALAQTEVDPQRAIQAGTFDRLADNLGALSFLIDMLSVQPQLAKSLFRFDPETGSLSAVMGQSERVSAFAAFDEAPAAVPAPSPPLLERLRTLAQRAAQAEASDAEIAHELEPLAQQAHAADEPDLAHLLDSAQQVLAHEGDAAVRARARGELVLALAALAAPPQPPKASAAEPRPLPPPSTAGGTGLEDDVEMRDIFIEEAREVIAAAGAALERLADVPENGDDMTAVRRAFHTLKGSARMIGLGGFGDASWACEQLYNARLANAPRMDASLRGFTADALAYLADWTEAIAAGAGAGHEAATVARAADALRVDGVRLPIALPGAAEPASTEPGVHAIELADEAAPPAVVALEPAPEPAPVPEPPAVPPAPVVAPLFDLDFDLVEEAEGRVPETVSLAPTEALTARVPDLPSAADLELPPLPAIDSTLAPPETTTFNLDLDLGAAPPPAAFDLLDLPLDAPPPAPQADLAATQPDLRLPEGEALEIDLDELDRVFGGSDDEATAVLPAGERTMPLAPDFVFDLRDADDTPAPAPEPAPTPAAAAAEATAPADAQAPSPLPVAADMAAELAAGLDAVPATEILSPLAAVPAPAAAAEAPAPAASSAFASLDEEDEQVRQIGPLRISIPLFNIYLNEADELSRRLGTELAEWALEYRRHPVPESSVALAHSLAGSSATVGYADLSALARALEHALMRSHAQGRGRAGEPALFNEVAEEMRRLLHQFAAGFLRPVAPELMEMLAAHERLPQEPPAADGLADPSAATDHIDAELFPIFEEEADELLPQLRGRLRDWLDRPGDADAPMACMRTLHTLKGGARLAGAMRLGERVHGLETAIEELLARGHIGEADVEPLLARADAMSAAFDRLRQHPPTGRAAPPPAAPLAAGAAPPAPMPEPAPAPAAAMPIEAPAALADLDADWAPDAPATAAPGEQAVAEVARDAAVETAFAAPIAAPVEPVPAAPIEIDVATAAAPEPAATPAPPPPPEIDWQRFATEAAAPDTTERPAGAGSAAVVRVRAGLLDRLVNQAGEVSIARARIDSDVRQMQTALGDLSDSLERMRRQLRDIEVQAETQITTRIEAAKAAAQDFDPLEMDRFTRFQELTRFMAESVNDVATLQRGLQRTLQSTEDELAVQARLTRELQDDLLRTRMIEFESLADRLHRTARQAAKETGKPVRLEIVGGAIEIDRGVLERMAPSFEHLLRNSVAHGIEAPAQRSAAGKDATGLVTITVAQSGNEVGVEFGDDGGGLDLQRIRSRAVERGLLTADAAPDDAELAQLIFRPGFSTADTVTELAGRGIGLDVVRDEVNAMGGRVETTSQPGLGTRFKLLLPLTTAVTQTVTLRCGELQVAVPSTLIELVRRAPTAEVARAYAEGRIDYAGQTLPFYWLGALLHDSMPGALAGRMQTVVIVRSAAQRVAVHVDEVVGNQEVVVKNVGPQLARLPGLAGVTLLPSGSVALIYNPVALASLYGAAAQARMQQPAAAAPQAATASAQRAPLVLVVDDSITVRRVTQRLLQREGYRVVTAKDGLEAIERLAEERPVLLLSDIEMPRMDGFDLVRNVRADPALAGLPVVMITSRIAQRHRDYAAELGVDHYLGKPYSEDELLGLVARYAGADIAA